MRFAAEHPEDYESRLDTLRDGADFTRSEAHERFRCHSCGNDAPRLWAGLCEPCGGSERLIRPPASYHDVERHCPLCGSQDYTITGANRVVSIGIDWGARFHCDNCGASYR